MQASCQIVASGELAHRPEGTGSFRRPSHAEYHTIGRHDQSPLHPSLAGRTHAQRLNDVHPLSSSCNGSYVCSVFYSWLSDSVTQPTCAPNEHDVVMLQIAVRNDGTYSPGDLTNIRYHLLSNQCPDAAISQFSSCPGFKVSKVVAETEFPLIGRQQGRYFPVVPSSHKPLPWHSLTKGKRTQSK